MAVWAWNAFIAAVAGNTVVWKPSPKTPLCAIAVQHICNQVMAEMGYSGIFCLFVEKETDLAKRFVGDHRVPLISFTGSSGVGQHVGKTVAARLGRSFRSNYSFASNLLTNAVIMKAEHNLLESRRQYPIGIYRVLVPETVLLWVRTG